MQTKDYLNAVKRRLGLTSDYAVAKALNLSRKSVSRYMLGHGVPDALAAFRIAAALEIDPAGVVAFMELERAMLGRHQDKALAWAGIIAKQPAAQNARPGRAASTGPEARPALM
jgi:transcriptional regulator with XRE-family HTH domain